MDGGDDIAKVGRTLIGMAPTIRLHTSTYGALSNALIRIIIIWMQNIVSVTQYWIR